ncbi:MAG: type IV pilus twitching motility protein PilT [Candidatus Brocadiales bacterium]|nr:type IV pilus twitching motility protein PilT [Candidatus Brocadiales bacterium]
MPELEELLEIMIQKNASDLHITVNSPPIIRVYGSLEPVEKYGKLDMEEAKRLCYSILTDHQKKTFEEGRELDFSFGFAGLGRFRGNIYLQRGSVGGVFRRIPAEIPTFQQLGLPPVLYELSQKSVGLILVTGPAGSGKSTTLAAIVDVINSEKAVHIVTIEDPIEFVHTHKTGLVNQREVGSDTESFYAALKHVLRQDPNVILMGETRDLETISIALTVAETGHLVLGTLHTTSTTETIHRIVDVFPAEQQQQIRTQLASTLEGVICQRLLPRSDGDGRVCACEVMILTPAIRNLIREGKIHQINAQLQMGRQLGMQTLNESLHTLYKDGIITKEAALQASYAPSELLILLGQD